MSERHKLAVYSSQTTDLIYMCKILSGAVNDALKEGQMPHMDPAVQYICHRIAFAGNGDIGSEEHYQKCFEFCQTMAANDANITVIGDLTSVKAPVLPAN